MAVFGMFGIVGLRVGLVSGVTLDHHHNDSLPVILSPVSYPLQNGQFFFFINYTSFFESISSKSFLHES